MATVKTIIPRYRLSLVREDTTKYGKKSNPYQLVGKPEDIAKIIYPLFKDLPHEIVIMVGFDAKNRIIGTSVIAQGSISGCVLDAAMVFKPALLMNASSVIVAHNHPSGDPTPSPEDRRVTERISEAGTMLDTPLLDHIIIGNDCCYSLMGAKKFSFSD